MSAPVKSESLDGDTEEHGSFWRVVPRERERHKNSTAWKHECSAGASAREESQRRRGSVGGHVRAHLDAAQEGGAARGDAACYHRSASHCSKIVEQLQGLSAEESAVRAMLICTTSSAQGTSQRH